MTDKKFLVALFLSGFLGGTVGWAIGVYVLTPLVIR